MRRLIYISRAVIGFDTADIAQVVAGSAERNAACGVTGMLWFDGRRFAQVLEGEGAAIAATMRRIRHDLRHTDIEVIADRPIAHRMFAKWAMIRADEREDAIIGTSFLVGYARNLDTTSGRQLYQIALASS